MGLCTSQHTQGVDNAFYPSSFTLAMAVPQKTNYQKGYNDRDVNSPTYKGDKKVLVICTEERFLKMKNGTLFDTGNHPVEALVPLLYLRDAGFSFDFATPTGKPVHFEMWAFPKKDANVKEIFDALQSSMNAPMSLAHVPDRLEDNYVAIFVPGGHGAMHLADNASLGKLLRSAHTTGLPTISLCHGPAALLSAAVGAGDGTFIYDGYKLCVFPDKVDDFTPKLGYMPGLMEVSVSATLAAKGCVLMNTEDDDSTHVDRELITGASPKAANNLGKLAADELVKKYCYL
jgi:molecular chaperone Hsp31 and glyoxalase 3